MIVNSGGVEEVDGGAVRATIVNSGGTQYVETGASTDTLVQSGGIEVVSLFGAEAGTHVLSGGTLILSSGNVAIGDGQSISGVDMGNAQAVSSLILSTVTIDNGGALIVSAVGGLTVNSGGAATGTIVTGKMSLFVSSGGIANRTIVSSGGKLQADDGGVVTGTVISTGGDVQVDAGGVVSNTTVSADGELTVYASGSADGTVVASGGTEVVLVGGFQHDTHVLSGGALVFEDGITIADGKSVSGLDLGNAEAISGLIRSMATVDSGGSVITSAFDELRLLSGGIATDTTVGNRLYLTVSSGSLATNTTISSGGFVEVQSGAVASGTIISSGGEMDVAPGGIVSGTIVSSGGVEQLSSNIDGDTTLRVGGSLDLRIVHYSDDGSAILNTADGVLTVTESGQTINLQLAGDYTGEYFQLASDSPLTRGTLITASNIACYCRGTLVLTDSGETPVEDLRIGDCLVTHSGAVRPIRWIGRRSYSGQFAATNRNVLPVQFRPGSLGGGVPRRDLYVSPQHAMFLDGMLVPAVALVNGTSILQAESIDQVEYFHIELETHDIILAEGAPSETFLDDNSRLMFHNAAEYAALYPDATHTAARYCAPRCEDGPMLEALRQRLVAQAAPGPLRGYVDHAERGQIRGWAQDESGCPVRLQITANGVVLGQIVADSYREDLAEAGIGDGRHSFTFTIPGGLSPHARHVIEVRRAADGEPLYRSPWTLPAEASLAA